jgi:hypothetical protein
MASLESLCPRIINTLHLVKNVEPYDINSVNKNSTWP